MRQDALLLAPDRALRWGRLSTVQAFGWLLALGREPQEPPVAAAADPLTPREVRIARDAFAAGFALGLRYAVCPAQEPRLVGTVVAVREQEDPRGL